MKTILAPVDFSPATGGVVATASALARALVGRVVLLNITQPPVVVGDYGAVMMDMTNVMEETSKGALRKLEQLRDQLESEFTQAEVVQLTGLPVALILEQANKLEADFIVLGSHGHTAFYDLLVGSTTAGIVKRSPCPVVIVPRPAPKKVPATKEEAVHFSDVAASAYL